MVEGNITSLLTEDNIAINQNEDCKKSELNYEIEIPPLSRNCNYTKKEARQKEQEYD